MARLPRLVVAGQPHHIIQRGTNQQLVFRSSADFERMLSLILSASRDFDVAIHAYVLMGNHFHLLATPTAATGLSMFMQSLGRSYVRYFNDRYQRTGTLWQGRYRATIIDSERYLFTCMAYIDLNPVRAGLAGMPGEYPWSSYQHNIGHRIDPIVSEHPLFWALGNTPFAREAAYKEIVSLGVVQEEQAAITKATLKGWVLGPDGPSLIGKELPRRGLPLPRGRPRKFQSGPI